MGVLDKITQMKKRGLADEEIIGKLRDERVSPREINDAMNQSQIKNAVSNERTEEMEPSMMNVPSPEEEAPLPSSEAGPAQRQRYPQAEYSQGSYTPKTKEIPEETYTPSPQEGYYPNQPQQYAPQYTQEEYQPQGYQQQGYSQEAVSTDTIIEIAEQVFSEKMKTIQKKVDEFSEFKTLSQTRIDSALERLKRIEAIIDRLQISILEKIGTYGKSLDDIKKEMSMMQDSFSKIVNPLVDQSEANFSERKGKSKKSVEDLFQSENSEEPIEEQTEQNLPEETFQEQPRRARKVPRR